MPFPIAICQVGKYVDWERTMRRDKVTGQLFKKFTAGDHGWNKDDAWWLGAPQATEVAGMVESGSLGSRPEVIIIISNLSI